MQLVYHYAYYLLFNFNKKNKIYHSNKSKLQKKCIRKQILRKTYKLFVYCFFVKMYML